MTGKFSKIRTEYKQGILNEKDLPDDPFILFHRWMKEVLEAGIEEPTAMAISTVSGDGRPSSRMVLLKDLDDKGFVFFTHYNSRKGLEIAQNPYAAIVFFWKEIERQVRVEGRVVKILPEESDDYFAIRPLGSQVSAIISPQSKVIPSREYLEERVRRYLEIQDGLNQRPQEWGGYRVIPDRIEFWQGRQNRLHDRILYRQDTDSGSWIKERLAP